MCIIKQQHEGLKHKSWRPEGPWEYHMDREMQLTTFYHLRKYYE